MRRPGKELRALFPQLGRSVRGRELVYLDNAATALKPRMMIEAVNWHYSSEVANIHRGSHFLGDLGTSRYEAVRERARQFLNARALEEIVFTKGTTEGLNLLAQTLVPGRLKAGDEILLSEMEHHSNIVPWQLAAERVGAKIKAVRVTDCGELDLEDFDRQLGERVKILSLVHVSNALGTLNPLKDLIARARQRGVITVVDAAQSVALGLVDVQDLDCDFLAFSGHKLFGPTGVGVVYGRRELLRELPPYQGGGSMIAQVEFPGTTFLAPPHRFEAGTPPIAEVIGLGAALDFVMRCDHQAIRDHEAALCAKLVAALSEYKDVRLIGNSPTRTNIVSFVVEGAHANDIGQLLDRQGIAVRTGHHCCQPLMARFGVSGTVRVSFAPYNDERDVDAFLSGFAKARELLS